MKNNYDLAYSIIKSMRDYTDQITKTEQLNFSLLASAAEGVTGNFAQYDSMNLGMEYDVCKKGFYTNSFHVPVDLSVSYRDKIDMEGKFHRLCNGGSITYIELNEMPGINIEAVKEIVEYSYENDCNYIGINFPMDNCKVCGFIGRISDTCPCCKSSNIRRLRRVSGYLSEEKSFTAGKRKELKRRKSHMSFEGWGEKEND
jgi:ribonucleoside-triphosphate reductase